MRVTVLGAGSWGTTVASLVCKKNDTTLWARSPDLAKEIHENHTNESYLKGLPLPDNLKATSDLAEAVGQADLLIVGVPTHGFRSVLEMAAPDIRPWIPVVSLSKGFEQGSLLRMTEVIKDVLPGRPAGALSGPNIAREIMSGMAAASVIATEDLSVATELQSVLHRGLFRVYKNHDVIGCEVGGALKNVVAIAAGIGQGLGVGDNTRAAVITRGLAELTRLGVAMGGEPQTFSGLAGLGDTMVTCISPHSRNRRVGEELGKGRKLDEIMGEMNMVAEGVKAAALVLDLAARHSVRMPIAEHIHRVILGEEQPLEAFAGLVPPGHEFDVG